MRKVVVMVIMVEDKMGMRGRDFVVRGKQQKKKAKHEASYTIPARSRALSVFSLISVSANASLLHRHVEERRDQEYLFVQVICT